MKSKSLNEKNCGALSFLQGHSVENIVDFLLRERH